MSTMETILSFVVFPAGAGMNRLHLQDINSTGIVRCSPRVRG